MSPSASLTAGEAAILEAIAGRLIPSDETGPGAGEAKVARYIQRALATHHSRHRAAYVDGLAAVDRSALKKHSGGFAGLTSEQQDAILAELERAASPFFELVRQHAIEGMFGDPSWGGNAGFAGWDLLGYPGPRLEWTEEQQRLDTVRD